MATANRKNHFKIVLLGEGCVGKTSLVLRYCQEKFNDKHLTTLQASFLNRKLNVDNKRVNLAIWDTAGQERFHALGPIYYRDSHGAILVFDITDEDSFQKVKNWVKELKKMLGDDICLCIAGNKIDLEKDRNVTNEDAEEYARSVGAKLYHTSAKLNKGIDELFLDLTKRMLAKQEQDSAQQGSNQTSSNSRNGSGRRRDVVIVDEDEINKNKKSGCCS